MKSVVRSLGVHLDPVLTMEFQVASVVHSAHLHLWWCHEFSQRRSGICGLITAEENAGQSESQTTESLPDSPPPVARVRDKLWQGLMTRMSEACMNASHRNIRSTSPEF